MHTQLPSLIIPSTTPFIRNEGETLTELSPIIVARVVKTTQSFTRLLELGQVPDPKTLSRYAAELVGLHKRLLAGTTLLSKDAVERYARMPGAGAERRARKELMRLLEQAYQAVEPKLPNELVA